MLSAVASIYGNGYSYNNLVSPKSGHGVFYNIQGDGWIESRSEMSFTGLAPWGNKISFVFNPWRPEGVDPAHLKVYLCGKQIGEFLVDEADKTVTLSLAAGCEPKIISFEVINPFVPSAEDQRELGAQVKFVKVHSKIGPPIVNLYKQLKVFLASILCALAFYLAFTPLLSSLTTIAAPAIILFLLSRSEAADFENLTALWILVTVFCFGIYLARILDKKGLLASGSKIENSSYSLIASIIVLIAGLIRFYGIKYGLPSNYHPDEVPKVNAIMRMYSQGSLDPDYFLHPSMLLYTSYGMNKFLHFFGLIEGDFRSTAFVAGRLVSAITGTLSVGLVYLIARRLFSNKVGLISAILLAVFPLHVACSRYMKEDAQLVFWILLTTWAVVKSVQDNKPWLYILSGLFAGISSSVKYSGFLSALIVAYGPWLKSGKLMPDWRWFKWGVIAALMFPVGFVLCTPYSILNSEKFIKDFSSEKHHMIRGHTSTIDSWSQYWMYHFSKSIIPGMGWIPTILGVLGLALLLFTRNSAGLYMFLLAVLFYLPAEYVKAKPAPQPERYILPCLPFLAIGAAYFI
ncbi:MAG: glycosyltransferase family 39 protein, partial [Bdellovibrionales bacterium]|nr:glycosyltransferase family 39 protein [Bdellovibrionales bacterium]